MDYNMLIAPATLISVQLIKQSDIPRKWMPLIACGVGMILGVAWAAVQSPIPEALEWFGFVIQGLIYGASAAGIYDVTQTGKS